MNNSQDATAALSSALTKLATSEDDPLTDLSFLPNTDAGADWSAIAEFYGLNPREVLALRVQRSAMKPKRPLPAAAKATDDALDQDGEDSEDSSDCALSKRSIGSDDESSTGDGDENDGGDEKDGGETNSGELGGCELAALDAIATGNVSRRIRVPNRNIFSAAFSALPVRVKAKRTDGKVQGLSPTKKKQAAQR